MGGAEGRGREAGGGPALHHGEHLESLLVRLADPDQTKDCCIIVLGECNNILPVALSLCFCSKYFPLLIRQSLSLP